MNAVPTSNHSSSVIPGYATLVAACERILPSDEGPGAREAGVGEYLARALAEPFLRPLEKIFVRGCQILDGHAHQRGGQTFADSPSEVQDDILFTVQRDSDRVSRLFFEWLVKLTLEGFLCDPSHGGNRHQVGWHFLGLDAEEPRHGFCRNEREQR